MVNSLISRWFINAMAASSLLLIELERIEQLADLALPGQQTAVQNSAWRALWPRLQRSNLISTPRPRAAGPRRFKRTGDRRLRLIS